MLDDTGFFNISYIYDIVHHQEIVAPGVTVASTVELFNEIFVAVVPIRYCSPSRNSCPRGYSCQYSRTVQRNICCGRPGSSGNTANRPVVRTRAKPKIDVCDKGTPYILKGVPQTCTATPCPTGYDCIFSRKARNYFCCDKKAVKGWLFFPYICQKR
ncbi:unnamed protein product [Gongylonema pulchrum]|uniref:EB domain-containing protein n=1 Tax=Gongylonema pulchrum TaxID=637853 RepID=A0A183ENV9_9BILA|nr:unnamed protein product [Gongylonema pulchrum]